MKEKEIQQNVLYIFPCSVCEGRINKLWAIRNLSEISRGGRGGGKTGEGHSFRSPSKGRVMKKMTGKEGGSQEIKPP